MEETEEKTGEQKLQLQSVILTILHKETKNITQS